MSALNGAGPKHENRLIHEKSPYLLQHAHNPVDWYPWGNEAFKKAGAEDKPVFLSIGYSTCHWCHVMERESFEDERVAEELNKNFVSVKVDREERPDVDSFYMDACMALNGSGGWPLSCFLAPEKKPFFAGTYFPKEDAYGRAGFLTLLRNIAGMWRDRRGEVDAAVAGLLEHISAESGKKSDFPKNADEEAFAALRRSFAGTNGGFGGAPKFPPLPSLLFLMRYGLAENEGGAFDMVRATLEHMRRGGICDAVGGGFFRYSTDERWLVPHFEKMLCDNAMHIYAYSEASALLDKSFERTARKTAEFALRDLRDGQGGFYTALDADSGGGEGRYYLWSPQEVEEALGRTDGARYCALYDVTGRGNFEGRSIPNLLKKAPSSDDRSFAASANRRLLEYRNRRPRPFRDDKVLTANNGLMTAALACAGRIFKERTYLEYAKECAEFVSQNLFSGGRLLARWRAGEAGIPAGCGDYAFFIWGLIELYEATFEPRWLEKALRLAESADGLFWDRAQGGCFLSGNDTDDLPLRRKEYYDGALPAANAVMAQNFIRLSRLTGDPKLEARAGAVFSGAAAGVRRHPAAYCGLLCAFEHAKTGGSELVIANGEGLGKMLLALPRFAPFHVAAVCGAGYEKMAELAPFTRDCKAAGGRATAYLCSGGACLPPMTDPSALRAQLERKAAVF